MRAYVIRRSLLLIVTLFMVSIIVFLTVRLIPGDIIDSIIVENRRHAGTDGFLVDREVLEKALGLDVPIYVQYGRWISNILLRGSLSVSLRNGQEVTMLILSRAGATFELGLLALIVAVVISLPVGIYSAIRQDSAGDYASRSLAIIFIAVPSFWTATLVMIYPALWWGWSPPLQLIPLREDPLGNLGMFLIPAFILGMTMAGTTMRMTRTMMLEVLKQDYIRTAWAKGLKERLVVARHALKNAVIPVVTVIGAELPVLVGGAVIIETIFALPGMGRLMIDALQARDYTTISGVNLVIAAVVVIANLLVDLSYAFLDPRVRYR